jgi:hypothetical protein
MLSTDEGRAAFWAESTRLAGARIEFLFPDGTSSTGRVLENDPPRAFALEYFGSPTTFNLEAGPRGGTLLTLTAREVAAADREDVLAGWVSVLLCLKAAVDHGIDLRNHDPVRTWAQRFVDN